MLTIHSNFIVKICIQTVYIYFIIQFSNSSRIELSYNQQLKYIFLTVLQKKK